jgi:hypothetical protein
MVLRAPMDPQAPLEGGDLYPTRGLAAPGVNRVDGIGQTEYKKLKANPKTEVSIPEGNSGPDWLSMARNAYASSESWLQVNMRAQWARNFAHYRSEHAPDSPILSEANKFRASYFWPKSRTLVRDIQAACAAAYFASSDVVAIEAVDQDNPNQVEAAVFMKELLNYRLNRTVPWYKLVLGAAQEAAVLGIVFSHQSWVYEEEEEVEEEVTEADGNITQYFRTKVRKDQAQVRVVPAENIRMSPAADWLDPVNSSPYFIELIPMYIGDVLTKMKNGEVAKAGEPAWKDIGEGGLLSAGNRDNLDTTRRARSGTRRLDPKSNMMETEDEFRIVWIHRNIIRHDGKDWLFYTAGPNVMLSEPIPLETVIPWADGKRDYVMGAMEIETDRPYPSGPVDLASGMQRALNELNNQRRDNVRQVLNARIMYKQGQQVDMRSLQYNVPGGLIGISGPGPLDNYIKPLHVPDVTASSYQESDRLALTMDDLTGSTTGSTVNSNRKLQETATGMNLMAEAGNRIREMELMTLTKTWMVQVLNQLVQLEAMYETDAIAMTVAAKKAKLLRVLPEFFNAKFSVSVNVGMGAVSPSQKIQKLQTAIATVTQLVPEAAMAINGEEIAKEIFGAAGYDNGTRFFDFAKAEQAKANPPPDPSQQLAQQQLEMKQQVEEAKAQLAQAKIALEQQKMQSVMAMQAKQIEEMDARIRLSDVKAVKESVTTVYEAAQTGGVMAQNAGIAPVIDEVLASANFKDHNAPPVVPEVIPQQAVGMPTQPNTNPSLPAQPVSAARGIRAGIETPQIEG